MKKVKKAAVISLFVCILTCKERLLAQVHVGPNVQVSIAHDNYSLGEVLLSADPTDPNRLLGCGIVYAESENRRWTVAYLSTDGGKSWKPTLETKRFEDSSDPACVLAGDGIGYFTALGTLRIIDRKYAILGIYRSSDGGATWTLQNDIRQNNDTQVIDRESIVVHRAQDKAGKEIYITGTYSGQDLGGTYKNGIAILRSRDGGTTVTGPWIRDANAGHWLLLIGNSVMLSDGTLVTLFGDLKNANGYSVPRSTREESNAVLEAVRIGDNGEAISKAVRIDDFFMSFRTRDTGVATMGTPTLAVDSGNGPFRDRVYATWADDRNGRSAIRLSVSADGGKTWSKSTVIDDVPIVSAEKSGPENFLPTVAVNKVGVVLVTWYDRRDCPDSLGWFVRARASLDGGETWLPSMQVSEQAASFSPSNKIVTQSYVIQSESRDTSVSNNGVSNNGQNTKSASHLSIGLQPREFFAGDYAGLAADARGTFHAFWIDNRKGRSQIWTATIAVGGNAARNGTRELAQLVDVSSSVEVAIVSTDYDRLSSNVTVGVTVKNSSAEAIHGPLKLRLVNMSSNVGNPTVVNADNQFSQAGAVWDVSSLLNQNILKPNQSSAVKQLIFRLDDAVVLSQDKNVRLGLLDLDIRTLAASFGALDVR